MLEGEGSRNWLKVTNCLIKVRFVMHEFAGRIHPKPNQVIRRKVIKGENANETQKKSNNFPSLGSILVKRPAGSREHSSANDFFEAASNLPGAMRRKVRKVTSGKGGCN